MADDYTVVTTPVDPPFQICVLWVAQHIPLCMERSEFILLSWCFSTVCGKTENVTASKSPGLRWPWQAAIYRRASGVHGGSLHKDTWFLVCSGALVNERTVVVAAHCVTELGKVTMIKTADLKVVLGKFYRDDDRDEKTIQNLRVREGCNLETRCWLSKLRGAGGGVSVAG